MESAFHLTGVSPGATPRPLSRTGAETLGPSTGQGLDATATIAKAETQLGINCSADKLLAARDKLHAFADRPGVDTYKEWDQKAVNSFITTSCDLPQYEGTIESNNITGEHLQELRRHDILNVGLARAGICDQDHQRRISDEMARVEQGNPEMERQRLSQTATDWKERRKLLRFQQHLVTRQQEAVPNQAGWDVKRKELSFGRTTTCFMPGRGIGASATAGTSLGHGRYQYRPRLELTRTAKLMRKEASLPAELFSSETRKTMTLYDSREQMARRHSQMAGAAASGHQMVKVF